jgi:hypothetical protein
MFTTIKAEGFMGQVDSWLNLLNRAKNKETMNQKSDISAKEKALELMDTFGNIFIDDEDEHYIGMVKRICKQCSLKTADELLHYSKQHGFIGLTEFYEEVKTEIQKL